MAFTESRLGDWSGALPNEETMLIHRNLLNAVAVATKDDTRYHLHAVQARTKNGRITVEATDGHCALRLSQTETDGQEYPSRGNAGEILESAVVSMLIPADEAKRLHDAAPKNSHVSILRSVAVGMLGDKPAGFATDLSSDTLRTWELPADAAFPNTDRAGFTRDDDDYGAQVTFDAKLLRRVLDAIIKADTERDGYSKGVATTVTLAVPKAHPETSAFRVRAERPVDGWIAEALIMPCRL